MADPTMSFIQWLGESRIRRCLYNIYIMSWLEGEIGEIQLVNYKYMRKVVKE